ncbi:MAG: amino acid transporter [Haloquadratum walsbyi J07HQW2]|jgi:Amino acid transporters|uniref:Amino acid transporter n=1 Tax=Haloquadratum walsbyi J07HQW2 TaxID=1238425 RepID=U1NG21_9EURY|nr:MAG: amino acid transporter [Haloquadratum walsbyi J07HQW2]
MSEDLAKNLGLLAALTIDIGTMIGAGIFVLPGEAILKAGSMASVTFILGGVIAMFTALSVSELGTAMPRLGGAYYYVNHALGPVFGSVAGWANWFGLAFASAFYMIGFGRYIARIFGLSGSVGVAPVSITIVQLIALAGGAFFILINYVDAKETG